MELFSIRIQRTFQLVSTSFGLVVQHYFLTRWSMLCVSLLLQLNLKGFMYAVWIIKLQ